MNKIDKKLREKINMVSKMPGVYLMKNSKGKIIYVGKAKNLYKRVKSYFNGSQKDNKTIALVNNISDIEWIVTDSELEALMLETNLIKTNRPKYNILMKDDKNYVYIKITNEDYSRVYLVRRIIKDGARYFGPYTDAFEVKRLLRLLNRIFPFFTYANKSGVSPMNSEAGKELFHKRAQSTWGDLTNKEYYQKMIEDLVDLIRGRSQRVIDFFKDEMENSVLVRNFEKAATMRDRINEIEKLTSKQKIVSVERENLDVVGLVVTGKKAVVALMIVREGKFIDLRYFHLNQIDKSEKEKILEVFIREYYSVASDWGDKLLLPLEVESRELWEKYLHELTGARMKILVPKLGYKHELIKLAEKNVLLYEKKNKWLKLSNLKEGIGLSELMLFLSEAGAIFAENLDKKVYREFKIEAYDISNLGDSGVVGSMVVWRLQQRQKKEFDREMISRLSGEMDKKLYRRFEIKTVSGQNDYAAMKEVLTRRFRHGVKSDEENWSWPDIVLIDGGIGQLSVVWESLFELGVKVVVISLAKKEEQIWYPCVNNDGEIIFGYLDISQDSRSSMLLQKIRDEAHRFAVTYQRNVRKKGVRKSLLDMVKGIGPRKKKELLTKFGSVRGILDAGQTEVAKIVGNKIAGDIFEMIDI